MVVYGLSKVSMGTLTHMVDDKKKLVIVVHRLACLGVRLEDSPKGGFVVCHNSIIYSGWGEIQEIP